MKISKTNRTLLGLTISMAVYLAVFERFWPQR